MRQPPANRTITCELRMLMREPYTWVHIILFISNLVYVVQHIELVPCKPSWRSTIRMQCGLVDLIRSIHNQMYSHSDRNRVGAPLTRCSFAEFESMITRIPIRTLVGLTPRLNRRNVFCCGRYFMQASLAFIQYVLLSMACRRLCHVYCTIGIPRLALIQQLTGTAGAVSRVTSATEDLPTYLPTSASESTRLKRKMSCK
jgi:hypothetical protein